MQDELTTLVCLFHHVDLANAAVQDLLKSGVPQPSISIIGRNDPNATTMSFFDDIELPEHDQKHLLENLRTGGTIVAVSATAEHADMVEKIFNRHEAGKIDEIAATDSDYLGEGAADLAVPIVEEEMQVGKRSVDRGGVRLFRRVIEIPVEQAINLRQENVSVERHPVDRPVTDQDLALSGDRVIELTETAEEAVVTKNARVVEEIVVGKDAHDRIEHIQDTVRRTEVEVEEIEPVSQTNNIKRDL